MSAAGAGPGVAMRAGASSPEGTWPSEALRGDSSVGEHGAGAKPQPGLSLREDLLLSLSFPSVRWASRQWGCSPTSRRWPGKPSWPAPLSPCLQGRDEVAAVGGRLAGAPDLPQRVPHAGRGPGLL